LFRKYYKQANDAIEPNRALIDKIFEEAEKRQRPKFAAKIYKFGIGVAAVLVVSVSAVMFLHFGNDGGAPEINKGALATVEGTDSATKESLNSDAPASPPIEADVMDVEEQQGKSKDVASDNGVSNKSKKESDEMPKSGKPTEKTVSDSTKDKTEEKPDNSTENNNSPSEKRPGERRPANNNSNSIEPIAPQTAEAKVPENTPVLAAEIGEENDGTGAERPMARGVEPVENIEETAEPVEENSDHMREADLDNLDEVSDGEYNVISNMLTSHFGEEDEMTGNPYVFEVVEKNDDVYVGRWRWLVDGHSSLITEFVVTSNMSEMYESSIVDDKIRWSTEDNLLLN